MIFRAGRNAAAENAKTDRDDTRPTIARIWRGRTTRERADEYEAYSYEVGIKPLIEKALGVQYLREDRETESEFMTISYWESVEAMARFTGGDPTRIDHLPRGRRIPDRAAGDGAGAEAAEQRWADGIGRTASRMRRHR